ncbi:MAG: glucose-6-phosphate isomerase [Candidatus Tokpelaia sp. JSC161]|jgi:glucose-6-phosphate isomerase|nr:MAG: glucose-6-phosphate isomerase [Candidatus Tokpelaia sp. JSC161]
MARNELLFKSILEDMKSYAGDETLFDIHGAFLKDRERFRSFSLVLEDLLFDFSKCALSGRILDYFNNLVQAVDLIHQRDAMFSGEVINLTENRAALHVALRAPQSSSFLLGERNVVLEIQDVLRRMEEFSNAIRTGELRSYNGSQFTNVVNIGIGGSDLGPKMTISALKPYHNGPQCYFISNLDGSHVVDTLAQLDPALTLIIISSKTFTTIETITNALYVMAWIRNSLGEEAIKKHCVAVSSDSAKVEDFGIQESYTFRFWDWVGGRYSIWSSVGLPLMLAIGPEQFRCFLAGAYMMDEHFRNTPVVSNIPMMFGLIGFWHRVICNYPTRVVIPYEQRLLYLPAYLQQLDMESNGKSVTRDGFDVRIPTAPVTWGDVGTNGQHAFFQLLHQGTDIIPVEFIAFVKGHEESLQSQHNLLISNCLAQAEGLLSGRSYGIAYNKMIKEGLNGRKAKKLAAYKVFSGNRPSIMILQQLLTPYTLGRLIALYEHRVFVEGVLMNINSFDQWGVELGKELSNSLFSSIEGKIRITDYTSSTLGIVSHICTWREKSELKDIV